MLRNIVTVALVAFLGACSTPGSSASSAQIPTQAAQNIGGDQGQAQAAETGSASAQANPVIVNALAAKAVKIGVRPGGADIEIVGADEGSVSIGEARFGNQTFGNENSQEASTSSGGGVAGATGNPERN